MSCPSRLSLSITFSRRSGPLPISTTVWAECCSQVLQASRSTSYIMSLVVSHCHFILVSCFPLGEKTLKAEAVLCVSVFLLHSPVLAIGGPLQRRLDGKMPTLPFWNLFVGSCKYERLSFKIPCKSLFYRELKLKSRITKW